VRADLVNGPCLAHIGRLPPYASSRCGACYEVRPVMSNIPKVLVHLCGRVVETRREAHRVPRPEELSMETLAWVWTETRDAPGGQG
jgi:L-lactate dehydrogenase complex protein LldF